MKHLFLLLVLAGCTAPKTETKQKAAAEAPARPTPPWEVDTSLEAFTNYAKYFKQSPRYPFILLKDGQLTGDKEGQILPVKFKNRGKVLAYTNDIGGVIINDEEILVTADELEKIYDTNLPFFTEEEYPSWTVEVYYQNGLYRYIYDHGLSDLKKIKPLSEGKKYLRSEERIEARPFVPKVLNYIGQMYLGGDVTAMFLYTIADKEEQRRAAWYFGYVLNLSKKGGFVYGSMDISPQMRWNKLDKVTAEVLIFDSPEKTHIRMLNLLILHAQNYHYDLIPFLYPGSGDIIMGVNGIFRF